MNSRLILLLSASALMAACTSTPEPYGTLPSAAQVEWQKMETNMFVHFGPNTFSGAEWGNGKESEDLFNPSDLDCSQWTTTAKAAGFKGVIITAKHHDGFCLWPNPVSKHTVAQSCWKDGKGDVLRELSEACREDGLKFGVYVSPWDRNDPHYGSPEYNDVFVKTLESALGSYGPVYEQWFDGACGEGPTGKRQVYDWPLFNGTVFKMQPDAIIFSNVGPGCRWMGNEEGVNGRTCWSTMNIEGWEPGRSPSEAVLNVGEKNAAAWVGSETDVSIRPGWFWRESENSRVKSVQHLLKIYYESVGRNSLLLLNVPADMRGHIHEIDSVRLMEWRAALDEIFAEDLSAGAAISASSVRGHRFSAAKMLDGNYDSYWAAKEGVKNCSFELALDGPKTFNRVVLQEYIPLGQRVEQFTVEALVEGEWKQIASETTIGYKRIVLVPQTTAEAVRVNIEASLAEPVISTFALFQDNIYIDKETARAEGTVYEGKTPLVCDLGKVGKISGFTYEPSYRGKGGVIITYRLESSVDGLKWSTVSDETMFDNIVNNPIEQIVSLSKPVRARYLRLTPLRTSVDGSHAAVRFEAVCE